MCLAIAMYLVTGIMSLIWQIMLALGIFTLTLLGKTILFICASIYTVAHPNTHQLSDGEETPFITMYPELYDFEKNYDTMARVSLETVTSTENLDDTSLENSHQSSIENFRKTHFSNKKAIAITRRQFKKYENNGSKIKSSRLKTPQKNVKMKSKKQLSVTPVESDSETS